MGRCIIRISRAMASGHGLDHSFFTIARRWGRHLWTRGWQVARRWSHFEELRFQEILLFVYIDHLWQSSQIVTLLRSETILISYLHDFIQYVLWGRFNFQANLEGNPRTIRGYLHFSSYTEYFMLYISTTGVIPRVYRALSLFQLFSLPGWSLGLLILMTYDL